MDMDNMQRIELDPAALEQATGILAGLEGAVAGYLHGSFATGRAGPNSDVDFAVLLRHEATVDVWRLAGVAIDMEPLFKRHVQIGILNLKSLIFSMEVLTKGQLLFCNDEKELAAYMVNLSNMYEDMLITNKEIFEAYSI